MGPTTHTVNQLKFNYSSRSQKKVNHIFAILGGGRVTCVASCCVGSRRVESIGSCCVECNRFDLAPCRVVSIASQRSIILLRVASYRIVLS